MHDLANQAKANVNANTSFSKAQIQFKEHGKTDLLSHWDGI